MESVLLSVLSVLAALGEVRPLERRSSLVGEDLPSGLAVCFLRPLRSVDICDEKQSQHVVWLLVGLAQLEESEMYSLQTIFKKQSLPKLAFQQV